MNWSIEPFTVALADPLSTARGEIQERSGWIVRVAAGSLTGCGESTPLPGWTESHAECERALEAAIEELDAIDDATDRDAERAAQQSVIDRVNAPAARHGLSLAFADLWAQQSGQPLYRWLGADETVERVAVNATVGAGSVEATAAQVVSAVDRGFESVKLKVGAAPQAVDANRLQRARERVGPDIELRADANGAWSRPDGERALEWLADADVSYVEQPLPADDLDGHARLVDQGTDVNIALDETLASVDVQAVLEAGSADVIVCKPMVLGGLDRTLDVARWARSDGVEPVVTTTLDAAIARAGAVHLTAALAPASPSGLATGDRLTDDLVADPDPVEQGSLPVSQETGHGIRPS